MLKTSILAMQEGSADYYISVLYRGAQNAIADTVDSARYALATITPTSHYAGTPSSFYDGKMVKEGKDPRRSTTKPLDKYVTSATNDMRYFAATGNTIAATGNTTSLQTKKPSRPLPRKPLDEAPVLKQVA
jgi:hypothetical protein